MQALAADPAPETLSDMDPTNPFWSAWYFHVPNYILALLMYLMMGRMMLSPFVPPESRNYIWRSFVRLTDPVLRVIAFVTPGDAPKGALLVFGFLWIFLARIALYIGLAAVGLAPTTGAAT